MPCPHPDCDLCKAYMASLSLGRWVGRTTHLSSRSALLSGRPWLSLRSLETNSQRGPDQAQAGVRLGSGKGQAGVGRWWVTKQRRWKASRVVKRTGQETNRGFIMAANKTG